MPARSSISSTLVKVISYWSEKPTDVELRQRCPGLETAQRSSCDDAGPRPCRAMGSRPLSATVSSRLLSSE